MVLPFTPEAEIVPAIDHALLSHPRTNISLNGISAVIVVDEFNSVTLAAKKIGMSQPGLTRLIQRVERSMGCEIFNRNDRPMSLTSKGEDVVASFKAIAAVHMDLLASTLSLREYANRQTR